MAVTYEELQKAIDEVLKENKAGVDALNDIYEEGWMEADEYMACMQELGDATAEVISALRRKQEVLL